MRPAQEFTVKMVIGVVALSVVVTAAYLIAVLILRVLPGNYTAAALGYATFFFLGFIVVMTWIRRQYDEWWGQ